MFLWEVTKSIFDRKITDWIKKTTTYQPDKCDAGSRAINELLLEFNQLDWSNYFCLPNCCRNVNCK